MERYKSSTAGLRLDNESELEITVALNTQDAFRGVTWWWPRLAGKQSIPSGHCVHCYAGSPVEAQWAGPGPSRLHRSGDSHILTLSYSLILLAIIMNQISHRFQCI